MKWIGQIEQRTAKNRLSAQHYSPTVIPACTEI